LVEQDDEEPLLHRLADMLPGIQAYDRTTINAWEDAGVRAAVKATSRSS
jgi:hypothetical protein